MGTFTAENFYPEESLLRNNATHFCFRGIGTQNCPLFLFWKSCQGVYQRRKRLPSPLQVGKSIIFQFLLNSWLIRNSGVLYLIQELMTPFHFRRHTIMKFFFVIFRHKYFINRRNFQVPIQILQSPWQPCNRQSKYTLPCDR